MDRFRDDLAKAGVAIQDVWDLVDTSDSYKNAIPILIDRLSRSDTEIEESEREQFKEALVRSLAVKEARGSSAAAALIREFRRAESSPLYRWAVGSSLEVIVDDSVFDDVVALAADQRFGRERQMLVLALGRLKNPGAVASF